MADIDFDPFVKFPVGSFVTVTDANKAVGTQASIYRVVDHFQPGTKKKYRVAEYRGGKRRSRVKTTILQHWTTKVVIVARFTVPPSLKRVTTTYDTNRLRPFRLTDALSTRAAIDSVIQEIVEYQAGGERT